MNWRYFLVKKKRQSHPFKKKTFACCLIKTFDQIQTGDDNRFISYSSDAMWVFVSHFKWEGNGCLFY